MPVVDETPHHHKIKTCHPLTLVFGRSHKSTIMSSVVQNNSTVTNLLNPLALPILASLFVFLMLKWMFINPEATKKIRLPPCPPKFPIVGNFLQLGSFPHRKLHCLAKTYGPLMLLHFGSVPVLVVSSAEAASEIMKTKDLQFADRPKGRIPYKLLYGCKDVSFAPYSEYWRQLKSICVLHLLSNRRVQSYRHVREEETALLLNRLKQASLSSSPVNLSEMFATVTNDVVCRVALGKKYSGDGYDSQKLKVLLRKFAVLFGTFVVGDYVPWLSWISCVSGLDTRAEKIAKELDQFLEGVIEEHISRGKESSDNGNPELYKSQNVDFVDILLWIQKTKILGFPVDRDAIKALILDMIAGGTDSPFRLLEWVMTELLRHPKIMKKLQDEVRSVAAGDKTTTLVTHEDLEGMPYLKAVLKEALRLRPPVPLLVPRESRQDVTVKGYDIRAHTQVIINAWAIGRDPLSWDEAEKFQPERFLNNCIDFKGHDFQLIPFGSGRRGCPGIQFAMSLDELILANIVHQFDWSLPGGAAVEDVDVEESPGFLTINRKNPLMVVPIPSKQ